MDIPISKTARQFGYIIWNSVNGMELERILNGKSCIRINFNGVDIGEKNIDRRYHRISVGYKYTRNLPTSDNTYSICIEKNILQVKTKNAKR